MRETDRERKRTIERESERLRERERESEGETERHREKSPINCYRVPKTNLFLNGSGCHIQMAQKLSNQL